MTGFINRMFYSRTYTSGKRTFLNIYPFLVMFFLYNLWEYSATHVLKNVYVQREFTLVWGIKAAVASLVFLFLLYLLFDALMEAKSAIKQWWRQLFVALMSGLAIAAILLVIAFLGDVSGYYRLNWQSQHTIYWVTIALIGRYIGWGLNRNFTRRATKGTVVTDETEEEDGH